MLLLLVTSARQTADNEEVDEKDDSEDDDENHKDNGNDNKDDDTDSDEKNSVLSAALHLLKAVSGCMF